MLEKLLISIFNKKWANRNGLFCEKIFSEMYAGYEEIKLCCASTDRPFAPPILYKNEFSTFNLFKYILALNEIMNSNQGQSKACGTCNYLKRSKVPELTLNGNIKFFTINHFTKCNANCVYCGSTKIKQR